MGFTTGRAVSWSDQKGGDRFPVNCDAQVTFVATEDEPTGEIWANGDRDSLIFWDIDPFNRGKSRADSK
jgi:hypothetical protein